MCIFFLFSDELNESQSDNLHIKRILESGSQLRKLGPIVNLSFPLNSCKIKFLSC